MKKLSILIAYFIICLNISAQWKALDYGSKETLNYLFFTNDSVGFIGGNGILNPFIYKTIDGGNNWVKINLNTSNSVNFMTFGSNKIGYISTENGELFKTIDGGDNWNKIKQFKEINIGIMGQKSLNKDTTFIITSNFIYKTYNGGIKWDSISLNGFYGLQSISFPTENIGYMLYSGSSEGDIILKTQNAGIKWDTLKLPTTKYVSRIFFINNLIGYVIGADDNLIGFCLETIDGGLTWTVQNSKISNSFYSKGDFIITDPSTFYLIIQSEIYKSIDAGETWVMMSIPISVATNIFFPSKNIGYALCYDGTILKLDLNDKLNAINDMNFKSISSYPNPAKNIITLQYICNSGEIERMNIYNISGKLIDTKIIDTNLDHIQLNVENYSSGVYLYNINKTSGKFIIK